MENASATRLKLELSDGQAKLENVVSSADFHAVAQEAKLEKYGLVLLTKYNVMEANGVKRSESARRGKSQDGVHSTRLWKRVCCTDIAIRPDAIFRRFRVDDLMIRPRVQNRVILVEGSVVEAQLNEEVCKDNKPAM
eukprot:6235912-Pyramimonas_sp.AAC.1